MKLILERVIKDPRGFNTGRLFVDNGEQGHEFLCWTIHDLFENATFIAAPVFYERGIPLIPELIMCHEAFDKLSDLCITNAVKHIQIEFVNNYWYKHPIKIDKIINPYDQTNQEKPSLFSRIKQTYENTCKAVKEKIEHVRL